MTCSKRSAEWKEIWALKGLDTESPLHAADGFDVLSAKQFDRLVAEVSQFLPLRERDHILDCGCGSGAFLASLLKIYPQLRVSGFDYAPAQVERARRVVSGDFFVADLTDLGRLQNGKYDHTISFSTMMYLDSQEAAYLAISHMIRITRDGGSVCVGEVSDSARRSLAEAIRCSSHRNLRRLSEAAPDHLYLPKALFHDLSLAHGCDLRIVDHAELSLGFYGAAAYRFSAYFTKSGGRP